MYVRKLALAATVLTLGFGSAAMAQTMAQSMMNEDVYVERAPAPYFDPLGAAGEAAGDALAVPGAVLGGPRAYYGAPRYYGGVDENSGYSPISPYDDDRNGNLDRN